MIISLPFLCPSASPRGIASELGDVLIRLQKVLVLWQRSDYNLKGLLFLKWV